MSLEKRCRKLYNQCRNSYNFYRYILAIFLYYFFIFIGISNLLSIKWNWYDYCFILTIQQKKSLENLRESRKKFEFFIDVKTLKNEKSLTINFNAMQKNLKKCRFYSTIVLQNGTIVLLTFALLFCYILMK